MSWAAHVRTSLLEPIAELELAAKLLDGAAEALLVGRNDLAAQLIVAADLPEIGVYARRILGKLSQEVHGIVRRPKCLDKDERDPARMPSPRQEQEIFTRDGWRCRFCGIKVICKAARSILGRLFPVEAHFSGPEFKRHTALYSMASSLDHVVPHSRGGKNAEENFVTACYCCQFGRGEWLLEEMELQDPRERPPALDSWDGLSRIVAAQPNNLYKPTLLRGASQFKR